MWDPYHDWASRNEAWYAQVTDSARTAIANAKSQYGEAWEEHCEWRQYKSLRMSSDFNTGNLRDSICVKIVKRGDSKSELAVSPIFSDTVRVSYRGWLMNTSFENSNGTRYDQMLVFDQSYFGAFDEATCSPTKMAVSNVVDGFGTALQYMIPGDDWYIYMPQELAYKSSTKGDIPAYSTLLFRIHMSGVIHPKKP